VNDDDQNENNSENSISSQSAAHYFSGDPSIAQLLLSHGIRVRDFMLVSFLFDQGPLSIDELAGIMDIEPSGLQECINRLVAVGLIVRDPESPDPNSRSTVRLTGQGQDVAGRIDKQL